MSQDDFANESGHAEPVVRREGRPFLRAFLIAFIFQAILVSGLFFASFGLGHEGPLRMGTTIYFPCLLLWDSLFPLGRNFDIGRIAVAFLFGIVVYASLFGLLGRFGHHEILGGKEQDGKNGSSAG